MASMAFQHFVQEPDCGMKITQVNIYPYVSKQPSLYTKACASIVLNDALEIHGLRIMDAPHGWFVAFPSDRLYQGEELRPAVSAIDDKLREYINAVVLNKFFETRG